MSRLNDGEDVSMVRAYYRREEDEPGRDDEADEPEPVEADERAIAEAQELDEGGDNEEPGRAAGAA